MSTLNVPITQAKVTRAEVSAAEIAGTITPGRMYFVTDEGTLVYGITNNSTGSFLEFVNLGVSLTDSSVRITNTGGSDAIINSATETFAGVLDAAGWTKLDSALVGVDLAATTAPDSVTITNDAGTDAVIAEATESLAGVISAAGQTKLNAAITAVIDDTDPYLGGDLKIGGADGHAIQINDVLGVAAGFLGYVDDSPLLGVYLAYSSVDQYNPSDGAVLCGPGSVEIFGVSCRIDTLAHGVSEGKGVNVSPDGVLYSVDLPAPGWTTTTNDTGNYDLGTGTGVGAWVQLAGTTTNVHEDVAAGDRLDVTAEVTTVNKSSTREGTIEIGFGIDGASPASGQIRPVAAGYNGIIVVSFFTTTHGGLTTANTVSIWARRASGSHSQFGVDLVGGTGEPHHLILSVPAEAGATLPADVVRSPDSTVLRIQALTQAEYDAIPAPDAQTLYCIEET